MRNNWGSGRRQKRSSKSSKDGGKCPENNAFFLWGRESITEPKTVEKHLFNFYCHLPIKSTDTFFPTHKVLTTCCQRNTNNSFKWDLKGVVPMGEHASLSVGFENLREHTQNSYKHIKENISEPSRSLWSQCSLLAFTFQL